MLLLIALAHAPAYLHGTERGVGGYPTDGGVVDHALAFVLTDLVTGRAYPLFAALFGYGITQLVARQIGAGLEPFAARRLIRRRGWWLVLFGFVHALLLWSGDILGAYGVVAIVLAGWLLRVRGRVLATLVGCSLLVVAVGGATGALLTRQDTGPLPSIEEPNWLDAAGLRLAEWFPTLLLQPLGLTGAVLLGMWAARRRLLEEPERHRHLLRRIAFIGLGIAVLGGLPMAALSSFGELGASDETLMVAGGLHYISGYGGVGYGALAGLVAMRRRSGDGPVVGPLRACGQCSLSCYLAQSVMFVPMLAAHGGGLGAQLGLTAVTAAAGTTWAATVLAAEITRRLGYRGPAEYALRRLTYRRVTR